MKRTLTLLLGIILALPLFAQEEAPKILRHEFNLGFSDVLARDDGQDNLAYTYVFFDGDLIPIFANANGAGLPDQSRYGIGYKYHTNKGAIRVAADFNYRNNTVTSDPSETETFRRENSSDYTLSGVGGRLGYELPLVKKEKFNFYAGLDVLSYFSQLKTKTTTVTEELIWTGEWVRNEDTSEYTYDYQAFGTGLALGLRYFLTDHLSVTAESRLDGLSFSVEEKRKFNNGDFESEDKTNNEGTDFEFDPLGIISLNIHF